MDLNTVNDRYKEVFGDLKVLKTEIEHLQHLLEKARLQLQQDFEVWWQNQTQPPQGSQRQKSDEVNLI